MACRRSPVRQPAGGRFAGLYDSMPSSPRILSGGATAGERPVPARHLPDTSQHSAADRKQASSQPAPATRSEQHHSSLAFSVPAFPMPEQHGSCAKLSKGSPAATLGKKAALLHDRAGGTRLRGGPEEQTLPKAVTRSGAAKGAAPSSKVHAVTAKAGHTAALGLSGMPASQGGLHDCTKKLNLRSTTGQSLAAAMNWEACSNASKQAGVPC